MSKIIIDIRNKDEFNKFHLDNSINIPFNRLIIEPEKYLLKDKDYLLVCNYGIKSLKTSEILNNLGYHTSSLQNGIKNYKNN